MKTHNKRYYRPIKIGAGDGNDPRNPNGMNLYSYRGRRIAAYKATDVAMIYRYLFGTKKL